MRKRTGLVDRAPIAALYPADALPFIGIELDLFLLGWRRGEQLCAETLPLCLAPALLVLALRGWLLHDEMLLDDFDRLIERGKYGFPGAPPSFAIFHASIICIKRLKGDGFPYDAKMGPYLEQRLDAAWEAWK